MKNGLVENLQCELYGLDHLNILLRDRLDTGNRMIEICGRRRKFLRASTTGLIVCGNPILTMGSCEMHKNIGLGFCRLITGWMGACKENAGIGIFGFVCCLGMYGCHVL
jgi:hypothetical protein